MFPRKKKHYLLQLLLKKKVEVLEKKVKINENDNSYIRLKLDSFIDSDLTTEQVNDLLDKQ